MQRANSYAPGIIILCPVTPRPPKPAVIQTDHETKERHARIRNIYPTVPVLWAVHSLNNTLNIHAQHIYMTGLLGTDRWQQLKLYKCAMCKKKKVR